MWHTKTRRQAARRRVRPGLEGMEERALLSAGALDTTFGGTGTVITNATTVTASQFLSSQIATGVVVQPDLKTIVVGVTPETYQTGTGKNSTSTNLDILVARYDTDGSLDTTFGAGGLVRIRCNVNDFAVASSDPHLISVALEPNGDIVIAGGTNVTYAVNKKTSVTREDLYVARLTPNGSFDTTFNGTGSEVIDFPQGSVYAEGVAIAPSNGEIVVGADSGAAGLHFLAVELKPNGGLDTTFGLNGQGYVSLASGTAQARTLDSAGDILLAGNDTNPQTGTNAVAVVRYTPSGQPDPSFGDNGEALLPSVSDGGNSAEAIGVQSTGQVVVSGDFYDPAAATTFGGVVRLNTNGSVDTTFGSNGVFYDPTLFHPQALVVQPNDEIVFAGKGPHGAPTFGYLVDRLTANGQLDPTFGAGGQAQVFFSGMSNAQPYAITLGPDGNITITGEVNGSQGISELGTARLLGS